jgi:hypothetical protein
MPSNLSIRYKSCDIFETQRKGSGILKIQDMKTAVKNAADCIRHTPAVRNRKNVIYAIVVKVGYEEIKKLRDDGYSYDIICKMLSENGALGVGASPKSLCTAFLRETKRRLSRTLGHSPSVGMGNAPEKKPEANPTAMTPPRVMHLPNRTAGNRSGGVEIRPDNTFDIMPIPLEDKEAIAAAEKEMLMKKLGYDKKRNVGPGVKTIRLPDGSFEVL